MGSLSTGYVEFGWWLSKCYHAEKGLWDFHGGNLARARESLSEEVAPAGKGSPPHGARDEEDQRFEVFLSFLAH